MQRREGIHFYVDIMNLPDVVSDEELRTGGVTHSMHALDTLFSSIERYGKATRSNLIVEKVTESRLHMYVVGNIAITFNVAADVSAYAYGVCRLLNNDIAKYKTLKDLVIRVGAAYGDFYESQFDFPENSREPELTTIGYAANYAAKLQGLAGEWTMSIAEDIYDALGSDQRRHFSRVAHAGLRKYEQSCFYAAPLSSIAKGHAISPDEIQAVRDYVNKVALGSIEFKSASRPVSFDRLNRKTVRKLDGIPLYADVRGFTKMFKPDGSNLAEMASKTQCVLATLYRISTEHGGIHVQFQGDRELTVFHNVPPYTVAGIYHDERLCYKDAVLTAMRMVDGVKGLGLHVGVGEAFGTLYATKIGARNERDNVLIGSTVTQASCMEDQHAGEDQVAITREVYEGLLKEDPELANLFRRNDVFWVTTAGYEQYKHDAQSKALRANTLSRSYNGAYGEDGLRHAWG